VDWGTSWHSDLFQHKHSTSDHLEISFGQPGSTRHSESQQQESRNCWGAK
jgi:hypothetical protein